MSRCGSCDLYFGEKAKNFSVTCDGDLCPEDCIYKLQELIFQLRSALETSERALQKGG